MVSLLGGLVQFVVSFLVGAAAIYLAADVVLDESNFAHAAVTAAIGSAVLVVASLFTWIPILGQVIALVALVAWVGVINARYRGGWANAAIVGGVAWLVAVVASVVLGVLGIVNVVGIPFV
jgi:uncharacterized membrane protein